MPNVMISQTALKSETLLTGSRDAIVFIHGLQEKLCFTRHFSYSAHQLSAGACICTLTESLPKRPSVVTALIRQGFERDFLRSGPH